MSKVFLKDISLALAKKKGLEAAEADEYLDAFFSVIEEGLSADNIVKIRGLGTFKLVEVKDRESVDVNTGERVVIDGHAKVTFTPENSLKELVNKPFSQFETVELNDGVNFDKEMNDIDVTASRTNDSTIVAPSDVDDAGIVMDDKKEGEGIEVEAATDTLSVNVGQEHDSESASDTTVDSSGQQQPEDAGIEYAEDDTNSEKADTGIVSVEEKAVESVAPVADDDTANGEIPSERLDEHIAEADAGEDENGELNESNAPSATEDTIAADSPTPMAAGKRRHVLLRVIYAIMLLSVIVGMFFAGFYFGEKKDNTAVTEAYKVSPAVKPTPKKSADAAKPAEVPSDTIAADEQLKLEQNASEKVQESQEDIQIKEREKDITPEPSLANAQTMVRTGAYNIVGTDQSVKVKPGQTMKGIAIRYLGEGMECYIQVYNKKSEVKAGETINIPKLQLKKKGRNKKVS